MRRHARAGRDPMTAPRRASAGFAAPRLGRRVLTRMRIAIASQIQYRVANYFYMIGMVAEPVIYLVVWRRWRASRAARSADITAGEFAAYYIVWTLVRNMNIVFTPYGWEERIRERRALGHAAPAALPDRRGPGGSSPAGNRSSILLWLPIALVPRARVPARPGPAADRHRRLRDRALGRLPHPLAEPVASLGLVTFWTTRVGPVFDSCTSPWSCCCRAGSSRCR